MDTIDLQPVTAAHLQEAHALNQAHLPHVNSLDLAEMERLWARCGYCRAAFLEGRMAGFLLAFEPTSLYDSLNFIWFRERYLSFYYIDRIIVAPFARRRGVATSLYADLERQAAERSFPLLACEYNLRPANQTSCIFHERGGFFEVGRQETENGRKLVSLQVKQVRGRG